MEWQVVTVIIALIGLVAAVAGPIVKLNGTITKLSVIIEHALTRLDNLERGDKDMQTKMKESHTKLHGRIDRQEEVLHEHDKRITNLERKKEE